jgi:hypothetical protein
MCAPRKIVRFSKVVHCNRTGRSNRILRGSADSVKKESDIGRLLAGPFVMLRRGIGKEILTRQREDGWKTKVIEHPALS